MGPINELATALAKAQAVMGGAKKETLNPHFKAKFADLESVWEAIREPLTKNGLSIVQTNSSDEKTQYLHTFLLHSSGQYIESRTPLILSKQDAQGYGATMSYYRRYAISAIMGVYQVDLDEVQPVNQLSPQAAPKVASKPGEYIIPVGKYKGQPITSISPDDIRGYCNYIMKAAQESGKPVSGAMAEFMMEAEAYCGDS